MLSLSRLCSRFQLALRMCRSSGCICSKSQSRFGLFGILDNAFEFTDMNSWTLSPLLAVIALITWWVRSSADIANTDEPNIIPVMAIIFPGTITTWTASVSSTRHLPVFQLDFYREIYGVTGVGMRSTSGLQAPSGDLYRIALTSLSSGGIPPLQPPMGFQNSSYALEYSVPSLKCAHPTTL